MDLGTMLSLAEPARYAPMDGPDSPAADRLYRQITAEPAAAPARRRLILAAVAGAGAAATATAVVLALVPGSPTRPPVPAAAVVLGQAALTAARQPAGPLPGPGQFIYAETIEGVWNLIPPPGTAQGMCVQKVQVWAAHDGSGRQTAAPMTGTCQNTYGARSQTFPAGSQKFDGSVYPQVADLPTALPALRRFILAHFGRLARTPEAELFYLAGGLLQPGAPPAVRAALYRLISGLPGVRSLGPMTDRLGRHGFGVTSTQFGVQELIIFDPATTAVLERETIAADPAKMLHMRGVPPYRRGQVMDYVVDQRSGVVDSIGDVPPAAAPASQ